MKKTLCIASLALVIATPVLAAPVYSTKDYGLVLHEKDSVSIAPFLQLNAGYGKLSKSKWDSMADALGFDDQSKSKNGSAYDIQLGLNGDLGGGYSMDVSLYYARLGNAKIDYSSTTSITDPVNGEVTTNTVDTGSASIPIKSYGLKTSFNIPATEKSSFSVVVGAGFMKSKASIKDMVNNKSHSEKLEGGQVLAGIGYAYRFNDTVAWNINYEHYFLATGSDLKTSWDGVNTGLRFYFK